MSDPGTALRSQERRDNLGKRRPGLALAVAVATIVLFFAGLFEPGEDFLTARRAELLHRAPTGETAIVEIDAKSLAELQTWPWSREQHAGVVRQLHAAGANIIAFDVDFSAPSNVAADTALAQAIREAAPVILPIFQQRYSSQANDRRVLASRPARIFDAAWVGGVNIFPDSDGLVREYPAATVIQGEIQPSIATLLVDNDRMGDRVFQPDWSIDAKRIPRFSFVDVLRGRVPASQIKGKRILIGATAIELGDRYTVPRFGVIPGVVVQALAADSLLQGRALQRSGTIPTLIGILALCALLGAGRFGRPLGFAFAAGGVVIALLAGPMIAQSHWPISVDSVAMLFAALVCVGARVALEIRHFVRMRALTDSESGLPNRLMLEKVLAQKDNAASPIVVAAAIERFDAIRDAIGIAATSEMIRNTATLVATYVPAPVYRIAPGTLAWLQPDGDDHLIQARLELIDLALRQPIETLAGPVDVALTMGLDRDIEHGATVLRIERALAAVGTARSMGETHQWYQGADPLIRKQLSMMSALRQGMVAGDVRLMYQPKLSLVQDRIEDAEALMRWYHPTDGFISPDEFIPLAESTGVVRELTHFALRTALADCAKWNAAGVPMRAAVNLSAADIASPGFSDLVDHLLTEYGVAPSSLALEITESAIIRSPAVAIATLTALRERGIRLSVDDYGTGHSTLSYLKQLPVHELKIDKSFVTNICRNESDAIMVRSTINLAHELGLDVVAEGIEDIATINLLRTLRCDYVQGYFIGKPMTHEDLSTLAASWMQGERRTA